MELLFRAVQDANDAATHFITVAGFNGDAFKGKIVPIQATKIITEPHTQEPVKVLASAKSHGMHFNLTGGATLSTDDHFMSVELKTREITKKKLDILKKSRLREEKVVAEALVIIEAKGLYAENLLVHELTTVLKWYATPKLGSMNKEAKTAAWVNICENNLEPPVHEKWTEEDESKLQEAYNPVVQMRHTAFGRMESKKKKEFEIAASIMSDEEFNAIVKARYDAKACEESWKRKRDETEATSVFDEDAFDPDFGDRE